MYHLPSLLLQQVCTCQDLKTVKHSKAATRKKISKMSEEKKDENIPPDPKAPSASRLKSRTFQKMKGGLESMKPNWDWETEKYGETTDEQLRERTYKMLTDGVGAVKSGVGTVKSGVGTVKSGVGTVKSGVGARLVDMTNVRDATSDEPTNKPKIQKQSQRLADTDEKPGADEEEDETAEEQSEPTKEEPEPIEEELEPAKEEASEEQPKTAEETVEEPAETAEEKPAEPEAEEEKPKEPETDEGKPEEEKADEQPEIIEPVPVIVPEGSKTDEGKPEEGETGEEKPEGDETGEEKPEGDEDEASKPEGDEDETSKPEGEPEEPKEPSEPVAGGEAEKPPPDLSSSSDSIPSTCTCLKQEDECADIMGKPTAFVYDNPCFGQHEMYMDPIYKLFPEDCDTYCGPHIEMPWSELTIPRNIKLRVSKRPKGEQGGCMCDKGEKIDDRKREQEEEEVIVCGNKDNAPSPDERAATKPDDDAAADMQDKEIEIQLSITQSTGDPPKTGDKSTDIRPTSREKGTNPNFICTCADLRQSSPMRARSSKSRSPQCKCSISRSSVKMNLDPSHTRSINQTCDHCSSRSQRRSPEKGSSRHARSQDPVMNVLETCEAEMVPLRDTLNQLKSKIRNLNIPELSNWNAPGGRNASCPPCPPMTMRMMPSQPMVNRPPCCMSSPTQKYQSMSQTLAQYPSMFSGMPPPGMPSGISGGASSPMPPSMFSMPPRPMTSMRGCCPHCSCKEMRMRMRRTGSSSTDYSDYDYDSVSEGESLCPFLRALSSKNIYRERDSKSRRKSRGKDYSKTSERSKRKSPSSAKRYNKRSQAESCRNDNCTDTEPEIQVHYEPKRPRIKTKQVFKTVVDPSMAGPKSQRLRIAVRVSPSGEEMYNDKLLAIQGPADTKDWSGRRSQ